MMRDALLRDLAAMPEIAVSLTHDARLPAPGAGVVGGVEAIRIDPQQDVSAVWREGMRQADASWIIAPETGGILSALNGLALAQGDLIGCAPAVVDRMADKFETFRALSAAGITTLPTIRATSWPAASPATVTGAWVVKPDDGVGCEGVRYFPDTSALQDWLAQHATSRYLIQPYQPGEAASLSMVCRQGRACLLSCNRQQVQIKDGVFHYSGSTVNALTHRWDSFEALAQDIAAAFPGLHGYVGVDVIVAGEVLYVVEINPRLTTSYAGLHASLGCNPARLILDFLYNDRFDEAGCDMPEPWSRQVIEVTP